MNETQRPVLRKKTAIVYAAFFFRTIKMRKGPEDWVRRQTA